MLSRSSRGVADAHGVALAPLDGRRHRSSADGDLDDVLARSSRAGRTGRSPPGRCRSRGTACRRSGRRRPEPASTDGTSLSSSSISSPTFSIVARSGPLTLTPIGARMPLWSMTSRVSIGCSFGADVVPGIRPAFTISSQMSSGTLDVRAPLPVGPPAPVGDQARRTRRARYSSALRVVAEEQDSSPLVARCTPTCS